jgi:hypothetical protein
MNSEKYIGLDVHQATISVAVLVYATQEIRLWGILTHCVFGKSPGSEFFNSHRRLRSEPFGYECN